MLPSVSQVKQCLPRSNSRNRRPDAYLHRYSKGGRICKWTASPKRQKKYPIIYFPSFSLSNNLLPMLMVDPAAATTLSTFLLLKEHHISTVSAANRLPALFVHLIYYLRKAIVNSHPNVCRALIKSLCKCIAREILVTSFQLFLTRYFLQPHPSAPTPYSKLGWPGSSSSLIPLAHNKQRLHSVLPGQDLVFINIHGRLTTDLL